MLNFDGNFGIRGNVGILFFLARFSIFVRGLATGKSCATPAHKSIPLSSGHVLLTGSLGFVNYSSHRGLVGCSGQVCEIISFGCLCVCLGQELVVFGVLLRGQ